MPLAGNSTTEAPPPIRNKKYDVYVSYSSKDSDWVNNNLMPRLKKARLSVFIDTTKVKPGDAWNQILSKGLLESRSFLPVVSEAYFSSQLTQRELTAALEQFKLDDNVIIPVRIDRVTITDPLYGIFYIDFSNYQSLPGDTREKLWEDLIRAIRKGRTKTRARKSPPAKKNNENNAHQATGGLNVSLEPASLKSTGQVGEPTVNTVSPNASIPPDPGKQSSPTVEPKQLEKVNVEGQALSDAYSTLDLLGYSDYVEALANFIESPKTIKPITIGIDAAWGGGKTSLMRMLQNRLSPQNDPVKRKDEKIHTVWFDAWQYDQQEMLWAALALEILRQVRGEYKWHEHVGLFFRLNKKRFDWSKLFFDITKAFGIALLLSLVGFSVYYLLVYLLGKTWSATFEWVKDYVVIFATLGIASLVYTMFKDTLSLIVSPFSLGISRYAKKPDYGAKIGFINQFKEDYKSVISSVSPSGKWPLVIFIDDLDRCSPLKVAEIVEAVNLLLDVDNCVFVLGMDSAMLSRSIQAKYKDIQSYFVDSEYSSTTGLGRHFLEKIIQIDFRIPRPDPEHISAFISAQLGREPLQAQNDPDGVQIAESLLQAEERSGKTSEQARQAVEQSHPELSEVLDEAEQAIQERAFEDYPEVEKAILEMAPYLNYNPRRIKRFINIYRLQALIAYERGFLENLISLDNLARWVVIGMRWPEFINAVVQDSKVIAEIKIDLLKISSAALDKRSKQVATIKEVGKYPVSILPLLLDPDFEKLITSIDGIIGEAQNYLGLNQLFMVQ